MFLLAAGPPSEVSELFADHVTARHQYDQYWFWLFFSIWTKWINNNNKSAFPDPSCESPHSSFIFILLRPETEIVGPNKSIDVPKFTICQETNASKSRNYKKTRYSNLHRNLKQGYSIYNLKKCTVEVKTLGLNTDFFKFCVKNMKNLLTDPLENEIVRSTVSSSFQIYCHRNITIDHIIEGTVD